MARTVWFPGHMAKGRRQLEALAANIDLIVEVRDARAPNLSSSPMLALFAPKISVWTVLSKADLADPKTTKMWTEHLKARGLYAWPLDLRKGGLSLIKKELRKKKPSFRDLRMAVVGIPNVGKSMFINRLVGRRAAPVGGIPGITKGVSWFRGDGFLLVDSPGILDPHSDAGAHRIISWIGSTRGQVIGNWEEHSKECIAFLVKKDLWHGIYTTWGVEAEGTSSDILEALGRRLGKLLPGGSVDMESAGRMFMEAFSTGRLGKISLEKPGDPPLWESLRE